MWFSCITPFIDIEMNAFPINLATLFLFCFNRVCDIEDKLCFSCYIMKYTFSTLSRAPNMWFIYNLLNLVNIASNTPWFSAVISSVTILSWFLCVDPQVYSSISPIVHIVDVGSGMKQSVANVTVCFTCYMSKHVKDRRLMICIFAALFYHLLIS